MRKRGKQIMSQQPNNCQANSGGPVTIGRQIRTARKAKGMTQWQLARAIGCSATTIGDIECGFTLPNCRWLPALAATLELPASALPHPTGQQ
jgi:transcriptional regulator with XRE-family HTH domain